MIRIGRLLEIRLMAGVAICIDQLVVVVDVALHTLSGDVCPGQRKLRCVMIKRRGPPRRRRMALCACLRITKGYMIGIRRTCKVRSVTIHTICWKPGVLIVRVTVFACYSAMCTCQRKLCRVVIKGRWSPDSRGVTSLALVRETRQNVRRTCRLRVVSLVTLETVRVNQFIVAVDVACLTERGRVFPRQCKFCCAMIEGRRQPGIGRMARLASVIKNSDDVIWICRLLIVGLVTRETVCVFQRVVVIDMARLTLRERMLPCQGEVGRIMVESSRLPGSCVMALRAELRIPETLMIRTGCVRIISAVAIDAV